MAFTKTVCKLFLFNLITKGKGQVNPRVPKPLHKACGQHII